MKKAYLLILTILIVFSHLATADELESRAQLLLSKTPEEAVNKAIKNNDYAFLYIPVCAEGMPGFDFMNYKGEKPNPKKAWSTCAELMGEERYNLLLRLEPWVKKYNQLMSKHGKVK